MQCNNCPRMCLSDRQTARGHCKMPKAPVISRAALHLFEEPCISGSRGSGTIFFAGCCMSCVYCQNYAISHLRSGRQITVRELAEHMRRLEDEGAHNINFVNPTHYVHSIMDALDMYSPSIPVVYNSGGYERIQIIEKLRGYIQIYLPDYKYFDNALALAYSGISDYRERAVEAIGAMYAQTGQAAIDDSGLMTGGTIVRHLVLPGSYRDSILVLHSIDSNFHGVTLSLMAQYTVTDNKDLPPQLNRPLTTYEYNKVLHAAQKLKLLGYMQKLSSSKKYYIPEWDIG